MAATRVSLLFLAGGWIALSPGELDAQVVQLPTFHQFSVATTVSVPDRGAVSLGGTSRGVWSGSSRGVPGLGSLPYAGPLFRSRGFGSTISASSVGISATIIDHAELDRLVLAEAAARRGVLAEESDVDRKAAYLSRHVSRGAEVPAAPPPSSRIVAAAELSRRAAETERERIAELDARLARGEQALSEGRLGAARAAFQVVARSGTPPQQQVALARLELLERGETARTATRSDTAPATRSR